jgi:hypothetical protein
MIKSFFQDPKGELSSLRLAFILWMIGGFGLLALDMILGWGRFDWTGFGVIIGAPSFGIAAQHYLSGNNAHKQTESEDDGRG